MSEFIEDFYYGNIEPQECTTNLTAKVKKSLSELAGKEEQIACNPYRPGELADGTAGSGIVGAGIAFYEQAKQKICHSCLPNRSKLRFYCR